MSEGERILLAALEEIRDESNHWDRCAIHYKRNVCSAECPCLVAVAALEDYAAISAQHIDHSPECFEAPGEGCVSGCPLDGKGG